MSWVGPVLGIDTSTSAISAAVRDHGRLAALARIDARGHTEHLAPLIRDALAALELTPSDLTAVVTGTGPGPFTGLRVGMVTAMTMGHALGIEVHGICSLDGLATAAHRQGHRGELVVATDARRKEVYYADYRLDEQGITRLQEPQVARPADLPAEVSALPSIGRGPVLYPDVFTAPLATAADAGPALLAAPAPDHQVNPLLDVAAEFLIDVAEQALARGDKLPTTPLYLRRPDAVGAW